MLDGTFRTLRAKFTGKKSQILEDGRVVWVVDLSGLELIALPKSLCHIDLSCHSHVAA